MLELVDILSLVIIDSHVHLSIYEKQAASLEDALEKLLQEMDKNQVGYATIIPDNIENDPKIADLNTAIKLTKDKNNLFLLGSPQIIQRGSSEVDEYKELLKQGTIRGLKFFPGHDPYYPIDERCLPYYELCQSLDIPVIFHTGENSNNQEANESTHDLTVRVSSSSFQFVRLWRSSFISLAYTRNITLEE